MSVDSTASLLSSEIILGKISEIALQIHQFKELESILQGAIADARILLQTDRVLIYRFLANQDAVVAFESVGAKWTPILGQLNYDPCIDATWVERYIQRQTTTLSDVHDGTIAPCYVQLLERLKVQANLVVPIFSQGTLWGLLIVHHCRSPREWQPLELQFSQHIALQLGIAIQQAELLQQHPEKQHEQYQPQYQGRVDRHPTAITLQANQDAVWDWNVITNKTWLSLRSRETWGFAEHGFGNDLEEWSQRIHPADIERVMEAVQSHFANPAAPFEQEYRVQHKDGLYRWMLGNGVAQFTSDGEFAGFTGFCIDIHDRKQKEELIQTIFQGVSATVGEAFFRSLVQYFIHLLGMDQAFVGELITPTKDRVKIIAGFSHEQVLDELEYPLAGTPCETVVKQGFCVYPDSIQQHFPEDLALRKRNLGGEGYVGIPLVNSSGVVIGLISVISHQAISNVEFIQEVLTTFAVRAASELERQKSEAIFRRYERIFAATPDCVSLIDRNYVYQVVNQTYLTWNQKSRDQIVGYTVSDLLGQEFFETVSKPFIDRCLAGESQQVFEAWQSYLDGQQRYIRATYVSYVELDGTISGVVINVHDLTDLKLAEEALRESEERFRQMANSIHEVFWMTDINFTQVIYINPIYEAIWGRSCASLYEQPKSFLESIHPEDRAQVLAIFEQRPQTGFNHEYRLLRPDGTLRWIWERAFPIADTAGHPYRLVGVSQDITDRKAAEIALAESQKQYQTLVENSPDIVERFDRQLQHLYVSPALTKITGIEAEVFWGKTCRDLGMNEEMVNCWETAASVILATGQKQVIEFDTPTLQGVRSFEMVIAPELSDRQMIESILCLSRDVTDRKATETALHEQQQFTEQIARSTLAILYVYDLIEQRNIYSNQQIEAVLGYAPNEIQAMGDDLFSLLIHPDDLPNVVANQQRLLRIQDDEFVETEYRIRHKTGDYHWLLSRDRIFNRTADGLPKQSLGVATDITMLKEIQASLGQQAERQRLLSEIAQYIRQTLDLDHILNTTVTEVRQLLHTDRVIIYQFEPDWSGIIIAESVAEGWKSILGMQITDTFFEKIQGQLDEQSRVKATDNIHTANLARCHIRLLAQMQVRAKLVVPILQDDHLWGLLVAQHCRSPRHWETWEIELQQQLATQIAIAIQQANLYQQSQLELAERQRAETALQQLNQQLEQRVEERTQSLHQQAEQERLLRLITQNIHRSLDLEETLTAVLEGTRQTLRADRVAVYQFNPDWSGSFVAESVSPEWVPLVQPGIQTVWQDTYLQETQGGRYRHNETFTVSDIYTVGYQPCHIEQLEQFQARAFAIAPIFVSDTLWGLLAVYQNSGSRDWQEWEISLLHQIGIRTAIALRQSHLYQAVQVQVKELERLNQLKDDFLSTVSHELRSPMSSIKMAIQMLEISLRPSGVLEDESNVINRYLKILREEGNREVSLINDLLDLARLDAGIEPLNLTTVALQFYIPHLAEPFIERTGQRQQQLAIQIPDDLPDFTTDLPFLERILTELMHNACKYTPAGETIVVSAQATSEALEIHVSNTGVEIPATECDRIFNKFYRVPNNDPWKHGGTGLGLALVKKLTERLGGSIHVESSSGQTAFILKFGFRAISLALDC